MLRTRRRDEVSRAAAYFVNSLNYGEPHTLVAYLYFVEGLSPSEIAGLLNIRNTEYVRNILRNIKKMFDVRAATAVLRSLAPRIREALKRWLDGAAQHPR